MAAQKKLFFSLRKAKRRLSINDAREIDPDNAQRLSKQFGLPAAEIAHMDRRMTARDMSLNAPVSHEEDSIEFQDTLIDEGPNPESNFADREEAGVRNGLLKTALNGLTERERHIFIERRLRDEPVTLEELGKSYGISRERVRQLENRAYEKVERAIRSAAATQAAA
jgi:RNA polymerase sigma-32 factor